MKFRDFHKNAKIRIINIFLASFVGTMVFPFMAIYFAHYFGAKLTGILLLINVIIGLVMTFLGGYFSDQYGRKKILIIAEVIRFFAFLTMALGNSAWFTWPMVTFIMLAVNSVCFGLAAPTNEAILIDVSTPEQRRLIYTIVYWANNISIAVGGILGALLFKDYLFYLFLALTLVAAIVAFFAIFLISESHFPEQEKTKRPSAHILGILKNYKSVLSDRIFVLFVTASVCIVSFELHLTNYIGIHLSQNMPVQSLFDWHIDGIKMLGVLQSENTVLVVISMFFISKITKRFSDSSLLITGAFIFTFAYALISYSLNVWVLLAMMVIVTAGEVIRVPIEQSYLAALPPKDARSSYMAFYGMKYHASVLVASIVVTLSAWTSDLAITLLITAISLAGAVIYITILPALESRRDRDRADQAG